ncbi:MAG: CHASE2 domain-containing protein [Pseudanabaenaceae cyanobacterium SKYGB_i_bin29]|nr:CHASE2 domain-containing protein [Pseudanabaenaceae cyanobacterium SKYG29]MDW8420932.1 CHASE2 domain-containing protein [Pseudanabaenaceae cyanobacterium SKYGB_i_bin29]
MTTIVIVTKFMGLWQSWELNILDWSFAHSPPEPPDHRIVIIGITEADIRNVGYPVPDRVLADLITQLQTYRPRAIGVDIFRDLPVPPGTKELQAIWRNIPQVIGIEKSVLPAPDNPIVKPPRQLPQEQVGFADVLLDEDGKIRRALLSAPGIDSAYRFAFATRLASLYLQPEGITLSNGIRDSHAFRFGNVELPRFTGSSGGYVRADSGGNQILINWRRQAKFTIVSLQEVQTKQFDQQYFQDKVIIIGYTAPFSAKDTFFVQNKEIYGVEYHAHVVSQILSFVLEQRPPLRPLPSWLEYCLILVGGIGGMFWALSCNSPWSMYGGLGSSIVFLFVSNYGLLVYHWWLPIVPTIISTISSTIVTRNISDFRAFLRQQAQLLEQRQRTLDDAFNAMHNGPLHTLGELLSLLKMEEVPQPTIITKLQQLDRELRTVYESLRPENLAKAASIPLHELLFEVYHRTMQRDFACFRSLKVRVPDIHPIDDRGLSGELKREICDFLEEALCNVGKHAVGATRLTVICKEIAGKRTIRVIDNGIGLPQDNHRVSGGTKHAQQLAKRLRGKFQRRPHQPQGTICELEW